MLARGVRTLLARNRHVLQTRGLLVRKGKRAPEDSRALVKTGGDNAWVAVKDKETGLTYWWNTRTQQTTAAGAPRPTGEEVGQLHAPRTAASAARTVVELVAWGAGITFAFAAVRAVTG